ncbi:DUF4279 domain-containing protein [Singulisphaera rosea]
MRSRRDILCALTHLSEIDVGDETTELEEEAHYFDFSATLRIFGQIPDLDEISKALGLNPTDAYRREERSSRRFRPHDFDMWKYTAPVPRDRPLEVHIQTLWSHIKPHKDYLRRLKETLTVDVFCGYRSNSCTAGFEVSYSALEMFVQLQIPFGVSVVIS